MAFHAFLDDWGIRLRLLDSIGALIITYTIVGVPYYSYGIIHPKILF